MAEKLIPVDVFSVEMGCPMCSNGIMRPFGNMLLSHPPQFSHVCNECAYTENFTIKYPYIKYKESKEKK